MSAGCFVCRRDMPSRHRSAPVLPRECWQAQPAAACAHRPPSRAEPRAAHPAPRSNRPGTHSENEPSLPSSPGLHYRLRRIGSRPPSHAGPNAIQQPLAKLRSFLEFCSIRYLARSSGQGVVPKPQKARTDLRGQTRPRGRSIAQTFGRSKHQLATLRVGWRLPPTPILRVVVDCPSSVHDGQVARRRVRFTSGQSRLCRATARGYRAGERSRTWLRASRAVERGAGTRREPGPNSLANPAKATKMSLHCGTSSVGRARASQA